MWRDRKNGVSTDGACGDSSIDVKEKIRSARNPLINSGFLAFMKFSELPKSG